MDSNFTNFWQFFHLYRAQLGYGLLSASINALVHYKRHDSARDSFVDVLFCGALGWSVDALLTHTGMPSDAAVIASCMIGYCGALTVSDWIKTKIGLGGK